MSQEGQQDQAKDQTAKEKNQKSATPSAWQDQESSQTTKCKDRATDKNDIKQLARDLGPHLLNEARHLGTRLLNEYTTRSLIVLVVLLAAFLICVASSHSSGEASPYAAAGWFAIAICVILFNVLLHVILNHQAKTTFSQTQESLSQQQEHLRDFIKENLSPSIRALSQKKEVRAQATAMIERAQESIVPDLRKITYFGAASLGPTPEEQSLIKERQTNDDVNAARGFRDAFFKALVNQVDVNRYIHLTDRETFADRSARQREAYLSWLTNQIGFLKSHKSYTLWNSRRGSPFGSTRSTIVTDEAFLDIIGQGDEISGVLVRGPEIAKLIKDRTIEFLEAAKVEKNCPYPINSAMIGSLPELEVQLSELTELHNKLMKDKEQETTPANEGEPKGERGQEKGRQRRRRKKQ